MSCLHGLLEPASPEQRLQKNIRSLDAYYQKQLTFDIDFDERYFINSDGRLRTPIKLISPISFSNNTAQFKEQQPAHPREFPLRQSPPIHQHKKPFASG